MAKHFIVNMVSKCAFTIVQDVSYSIIENPAGKTNGNDNKRDFTKPLVNSKDKSRDSISVI
jgi:hypothetical protein